MALLILVLCFVHEFKACIFHSQFAPDGLAGGFFERYHIITKILQAFIPFSSPDEGPNGCSQNDEDDSDGCIRYSYSKNIRHNRLLLRQSYRLYIIQNRNFRQALQVARSLLKKQQIRNQKAILRCRTIFCCYQLKEAENRFSWQMSAC